jgi:cell division protein FtsL
MSLAEEIVRLPQAPLPAPQEPERKRAPRPRPKHRGRRRAVATITLAGLWCAMAAAGIWMAHRQATMNAIAFEISALQEKIKLQAAQNQNLQSQITVESSQARILAKARERLGMRPPTAAELQELPVDQAQVIQKTTPAQPVAEPEEGGFFAWIGQAFQGIKGIFSAHK